jgi:hypothetical protein
MQTYSYSMYTDTNTLVISPLSPTYWGGGKVKGGSICQLFTNTDENQSCAQLCTHTLKTRIHASCKSIHEIMGQEKTNLYYKKIHFYYL